MWSAPRSAGFRSLSGLRRQGLALRGVPAPQPFGRMAWKQQLPSRSFATNPNNKSSRRNSNSHNKHQKKQQKVDQDSAQGEEARRIDERARSNLRNIVFGSAAGVAVALGMVLVENWDNWFGSGSGNVAQAQEASQQPAPSPAQLRRMIQQAQQALEDMRQYLTEIPEDSEWYAVAAKWLKRAEETLEDDSLKAEDRAMRVMQCRRYFEAIQQGATEPKRSGVRVVDDVNFAQEIFNDDKDVVLFMHGGSTCVSCTVGKPRIDLLALVLAEVPTLKFVKMNVTEPHCRHISPEDGFVYPVVRILGGRQKLQAPSQESNVGVEALKVCNPSTDIVEAVQLIHQHCDHKFDLDKVLDRLFLVMQYFEDLPEYKFRRPEHLWLPRAGRDPVAEQARRSLARYFYDLRGFEAAAADDSAWLRDPAYQAPNGSRSSVRLAEHGIQSRADLEATEGDPEKFARKSAAAASAAPASKKAKPSQEGKAKEAKAKALDANDFLTLVQYIWGPLASQSFRFQAEEAVRGFEGWDTEAEEYILQFLQNEKDDFDDSDVSVLQFLVQTNLSRYNAMKQVVDSRRNVAKRLSDDLEKLKQQIRLQQGGGMLSGLPEDDEQ